MSSSAQNNVDFDALIDLSEFDRLDSSSPSPQMSSKPTFAAPVTGPDASPSIGSTLSTTQTLSGPSHNYELYRQQTGFVTGAIANTMAVNESNNAGYQEFDRLDYLDGFPPNSDLFDFNTSPSHDAVASEIMDFDSPSDSQQLFTINPSSIEQAPSSASPSMSSQTSSVGRLWPGAHSQAALAKAQAQAQVQAQQKQQQQQAQAQAQTMPQQQAQRQVLPQPSRPRAKAPQPSDPFVEQKITQLLNSMRANPSAPGSDASSSSNLPRLKKEEEDMDADERLLASEEGKKLSSKERRQLRNKVSARAFRSRRKEYISQLESEVAGKVTENNELRSQNRALLEENRRLSDLTRMLLSSPSFSNFLDHLSVNPMAAAPPPAPVKAEPHQQQQQPEQRNLPKDVNTYMYQPSQEQIGMAMIPEQNVDFSLLAQGYGTTYQPQVFLMDTPALPAPLDMDALSGKPSNVIGEKFASEDDKVEIPVVERFMERLPAAAKPSEDVSSDEDFEADPEFALFHSDTASDSASRSQDEDSAPPQLDMDIFGGIKPEKVFSRIVHVDSSTSEDDETAIMAMARVQAISARIEPVVSRLELLTRGS